MVYQWKPQTNIPVAAQVAGEILEELRTENDGRLLPHDVVAIAEPPNHPLHLVFEWDNDVAAQRYREEQARHLIRSVVLVDFETMVETPIRAFVSVRQPGDTDRSYTSISVAMRDPDLAEQVVERARRELASWRQRYEALRSLSRHMESLFAEIERFTN